MNRINRTGRRTVAAMLAFLIGFALAGIIQSIHSLISAGMQ